MKVFKSQIENNDIFLVVEDSSGNVYQSKVQIKTEAEYTALLARLKMHADEKIMLNNNITTANTVFPTLLRRIANRVK